MNGKDLVEIVKESVQNLEMVLSTGPLRYRKGEHSALVPSGFQQSQNDNELVLVFYDNVKFDSEHRFQFKNSIKWKTSDGKKPNLRPFLKTTIRQPNQIGAILLTIASNITIICGILICWIYHFLKISKNLKSLKIIRSIQFIGLILLQIPIILFPNFKTFYFCLSSPPFVVIGLFLISISGWFKISLNFLKNRDSTTQLKISKFKLVFFHFL